MQGAPPEAAPVQQSVPVQEAPAQAAQTQQTAPMPEAPIPEAVAQEAPLHQQAPTNQPPPPVQAAGGLPTIDAVTVAWNESILSSLSGSVKARFSAGHFQMNGTAMEFALPNGVHRDRCQDVRGEVDAALSNHFGVAIPMEFVVGEPTAPRSESIESTPTTTEDLLADEIMDVHELADATDDVSASVMERLEEKFPGVEFLEPQ